MNPRLVLAPLAVSAVVLAALVVGDGTPAEPSGQDDAPSSAATSEAPRAVTAAEFCSAFGALAVAQDAQLDAASPEAVADLKAAAAQVGALAPGITMSADARAGVEFVVATFTGLPDDATAQDVVESDDGATLRDDADAQALAAFLGESCGRSPAG